jgi:Uncharacterized conserved protein (DUF2163)/Phage conserved hypothetical protein BR0599
MAFDPQEFSIKGGQPYWLYQFARGAAVTRLAAHPVALSVDGQVWEPSPISHDILEQTGNVERSELELILPLSDPFAITLLSLQTMVMTLTIFRGHFTDVTAELRQYWKGRIVSATSSGTEVRIKTENVFTSLRRPGCRVRVQRTCRHDLYGHGCNLNKDAWAVAATITGISGVNLTVPVAGGYPSGRFRAGMVLWQGNYGFVQAHSGTTLGLIADMPGLDDAFIASGAQACTIYPGCDRSLDSGFGCTSFGNHLNYGGFKWIPQTNPFTTSIV